jgi:hypothetical protein
MYQLQWMSAHGYSISDIIDSMQEYVMDFDCDDYGHNIIGLFEDWNFNTAFNGSSWVCYKEFLENEFLEINYVNMLILRLYDVKERTQLLAWYKNYQRSHKELDWKD